MMYCPGKSLPKKYKKQNLKPNQATSHVTCQLNEGSELNTKLRQNSLFEGLIISTIEARSNTQLHI